MKEWGPGFASSQETLEIISLFLDIYDWLQKLSTPLFKQYKSMYHY